MFASASAVTASRSFAQRFAFSTSIRLSSSGVSAPAAANGSSDGVRMRCSGPSGATLIARAMVS
jgi:hypothetical protein